MANRQDIERRIRELAARQHGVVARRQLRRLGIRPDALRRRVVAGRLAELTSRVLIVAGAPLDESARLMAAVLDAGARAVVSHHTAAALWRLPGFRVDPIHVIARRGQGVETETLAIVHEPRRMRDAHVVELDNVPLTTPTRVLFDLAAASDVSGPRLGRLIDTAWARTLVSHASLTKMLSDLEGRGRPGIALMRELLAARPRDHVPPESSTEARFQELAVRAGLRHLVRQVDVGGDDGWVGRVDFVDTGRRLVVEVGDALFHGSLTDRVHDEVRRRALEAAGWTVVEVDAFDIFHRVDELVVRLRRIAASTRPSELVR